MGNAELREEWVGKLEGAGFKMVILISDKAVVSKIDMIEEGSVIIAGAVVQAGVKIGKGVLVPAGAIVLSISMVPDKTEINYGEVWRNV